MNCPLNQNNLFSFLWQYSSDLKLNVLQINQVYNKIKENIHHTKFTQMDQSELENGLNKSGLATALISRFICVLANTAKQSSVDTNTNNTEQTTIISEPTNDTQKLQTHTFPTTEYQAEPPPALEHQLSL